MKKIALSLMIAGLLSLGSSAVSAQPAAESTTAPKTVIHVVTVNWKNGATKEQIQAALDGAQALTKSFPGIKRVWTRAIKVQGGKDAAIVMEFADEQALKDYAGSDAQKAWYKLYMPVRDESTTFDITN